MRKPRYLKKGATYKTVSYVNRDKNDLETVEMKQIFMNNLKKVKEKYNFLLKSFIILDAMVILVIKPLDNESLSKIMQWLLSMTAKEYNAKYGCRGHLWIARFKSMIVDSMKDLLEEIKEESKKLISKSNIEPKQLEYSAYCLFKSEKLKRSIVDVDEELIDLYTAVSR